MVVAAMFSGFVIPNYLLNFDLQDQLAATVGENDMRAMRSVNKCFDLLGVAALSWGIFQFGLAGLQMPSRNWLLCGISSVVGFLGVVGIFTGHTNASVPGIIVFAVLVAAWLIAAGISLLRNPT
ncbi:MAG: hypothetical protein AAGG44_11630 [Planctomycetota bacterium]